MQLMLLFLLVPAVLLLTACPKVTPPPPPTGITGYVTNANAGEPVSGARIEVRRTGTTTVVATVSSDASGRCSVDLPAGAYDLVLSNPGYAGSKVIGARSAAPRHQLNCPAQSLQPRLAHHPTGRDRGAGRRG